MAHAYQVLPPNLRLPPLGFRLCCFVANVCMMMCLFKNTQLKLQANLFLYPRWFCSRIILQSRGVCWCHRDGRGRHFFVLPEDAWRGYGGRVCRHLSHALSPVTLFFTIAEVFPRVSFQRCYQTQRNRHRDPISSNPRVAFAPPVSDTNQ